MELDVLKQLAGNGVLGLMVAILLYAFWKKDQELREVRAEMAKAVQEESRLRIDDNKAMLTVITSIQEKVILAVTKLGDIHEAYEQERKDTREANRRTGA